MSRPPTLRIGAGSLKGRRLVSPAGARPTGGRVREAVLSIWGDRLAGAEVLDLFAGSGAIGLEAVSRGAARATFVESSPASLAALRRNLELAPTGCTRLLRIDALAALGRLAAEGARFDLLFADPPYGLEVGADLARALAAVAAPAASWILEHRRRAPRPLSNDGWTLVEARGYGDSEITIYARDEATAAGGGR